MSSRYAEKLERELSIANQQAHDSIVECSRLLAENQRLTAERDGAEKAGRAEAERFLGQLDDLRVETQRLRDERKELRKRLRAACEPCAECGHIDWRELDDILGDTDREQPLVAASGVEPVPGSSTHAPEVLAGDTE